MDRRIVLTIILLSTPFTTLFAQFCGTVTDEAFMARFDRMIEAHARSRQASMDPGVAEIPVTFHIEIQNGTPVTGDARIATALAATNAWYRDAGIRFIVCGDTRFFPEGTSPVLNRHTVNVGMFRQIEGCGTTMGSYVFINLNCKRTLENILSHELGHVLGLPHTHGYNNTGTTDELVDGSNCTSAGDRFCDTPADPNLLGFVDQNCAYTGAARDANGMAYHPLTDNIMSYTSSECADSLTPMQKARLRAVALASPFTCCFVPAPVTRDTTVCVGSTAMLHAVSPVATLAWYDTLEGGTPVGFGPEFQTPPLDMTRAWYVEAIDSCASDRACATVFVEPAERVLTDGVRLVRQVDTSASVWAGQLRVVGSRLVFNSRSGVWTSDGTANGTRLLMPNAGDGSSTVVSLTGFNGVVLMGMDGNSGPSLWKADAVTGTVTELMRFGAREGRSNFALTDAGEWALFMLNDGAGGAQLWRTDASTAGTIRVADLPECSAFNNFSFTPFDGRVLFRANDSTHGMELWCTDGTPSGTRLLQDIWPGSNSSNPTEFTLFRGRVYFAASDSAFGRELRETDGTQGSCRCVTDINPGVNPSEISAIAAVTDGLCFSATSWGYNNEPYFSDGTKQGTRCLGEINKTQSSYPRDFTELNSRIYCIAFGRNGTHLWALDPAGILPPREVRNISPPNGNASVHGLMRWNGRLYFVANDGVHGDELWRSDGTENGTAMLCDLDPTPKSGSMPQEFQPFGGSLYFTAKGTTKTCELYALAPESFETCSGSAVTIVVPESAGSVRWFETETSPAPIAIGSQWRSPTLYRSRVYWVDVTIGDCASRRQAVPVLVRAPDPVVHDTSVTPGSDVLISAFVESGTLEWWSDSLAAQPSAAGSTVLLPGLQADTTLWVSSVEETCRSRRMPVHVYVRTVGIDTPPQPGPFSVYPQPVRDELLIREPSLRGITDLVVYDMLGRALIRRTVEAESGGVLRIDVSQLPDGQYLAVGKSGCGFFSVRFLTLR